MKFIPCALWKDAACKCQSKWLVLVGSNKAGYWPRKVVVGLDTAAAIAACDPECKPDPAWKVVFLLVSKAPKEKICQNFCKISKMFLIIAKWRMVSNSWEFIGNLTLENISR